MAILEIQSLEKIYTARFGSNQVHALTDVSFSVEQGEYVAIMGESGSGKSTLLNILAALDKPTKGDVFLEGKPLSKIKEKEISTFRRDNLGFVFQDFNLLDTFTLQDNIFLPLVLSGKNYRDMISRLRPIAPKLGIEEILLKYPYEVSGGQKQRAAIARAIITNPKLILADEPTGNLDSDTAGEIIEILKKLAKERNKCVIVVTHSKEVANSADIILELSDKKLRKISIYQLILNMTESVHSLM